MPYKSVCTVLTAQNATETTRSLVDTVNVPGGCKKLVGVGSQVSVAGLTTLEDFSHMIELECQDTPWNGTQQFLGMGVATALTSGTAVANPYLHPCDIPVPVNGRIQVYATYNKAQTINPSTRVQLVFE